MSEGRFEDLGVYKNKVLESLVSSDTIVKLLHYDCMDALSKPSIKEPDELVYTKIFPYKFIPEVTNESSTYITMSFRNFTQGSSNPQFKFGDMVIYMFSHIDIWRINEGLRPDVLLNEVDKLFKDSTNEFGIGKLKLDMADEFWLNDKFGGYVLVYKMCD